MDKLALWLSNLLKTKAVPKTLGFLVVLVLLVNLALFLPSLQVRRTPLPDIPNTGLSPSLGEVSFLDGTMLVAQTNTRSLYLTPATRNLRVVCNNTGVYWNAIRSDAPSEHMSLFEIMFLSQDDIQTTWNSHIHSAGEGYCTIELIENGVRITSVIQNTDPTDINLFMPRRAPRESFEFYFIDGIPRLVAEGVLTEEEGAHYRSTLDLVFSLNEEGGFYYNRLQQSPPLTALNQLLRLTRMVGYTLEQLVLDESYFDLPEQMRRPNAGFTIPVEFTLCGDDFLARVATYHIEVYNDFFTLTAIRMLPNFGSVNAEESSRGYIFLPDGAGALVRLNSFDANFGGYERHLYANTTFRDINFLTQFPEDLHMPVFGMLTKDHGTGFMGIIESGDETAFISSQIGVARLGQGGNLFNRVSAGFDVQQFIQMSVAGGTMGNFIVGTGMLDINFQVRYMFFTDNATYFCFALAYRNYLINRFDLEVSFPTEPRLFLEFTGTVSVEGRFLGQAYERRISLTTYYELAEILWDLRDISVVVGYNGVFNNGTDNRLGNRADLVRENGSRAGLDRLKQVTGDLDMPLFLGVNLGRVSRSGNGFRLNTHASRWYNGNPAIFFDYSPVNNLFRPFSPSFYQLNVAFLPGVVDGFLGASEEFGYVWVTDLATDFFGCYRRNRIVPPRIANAVVQESLARIGGSRNVALSNPNMNSIPHGTVAVNISRESSNFGAFYTSIPFRQLVMNGLIDHTTLNVNMSGVPADYFLLQALETGSMPKFGLTARNSDELTYTRHTGFMSTQFSVLRQDVVGMYERYKEAFSQLGSFEIANHEKLSQFVFRTTFANGASVIVNYNRFAYTLDDGRVIQALGFILEGGE